MSYLVLLRFNSQQNVDMFLLGPQATPLHAEQVQVPSGYTPPAPGLGSPGSSAVSEPKFIVLAPDTLSQIPQGYQPLITYDLSPSTGPVIVGPVSPTIDPSQLTVKGGPTFDNTIINQGIPTTNYTDQLPPPPGPIDFEPIYYDPTRISDQTPNYYNLPQPPEVRDLPTLPDLFDPNLTDLYFYPRDINPESWDFQYDSRTDIPGPNEGRYYYTPETPGDVPGLIIPTPRSFDPGMDTAKHRPSLRQPISENGGGPAAPPAAWGCTPPSGPNQPQIFILDDSCSVYNSSTGGNNFCTAITPPTTTTDNWVDINIPVNDAASPVPSLVSLWCEDVSQTYDPTIFDSSRGGVQVIRSGQTPSTAPIRSYSVGIGTLGQNFISSTSGAIAANGTILVPVSEWDTGLSTIYPRISRDFGATFSDVTGLPVTSGVIPNPGIPWTRAALSQNASVMYIHRYNSFIYKSIDGGNTWNSLANSPHFVATHNVVQPGRAQNSMQLRCSKNGNVVAGIDWGGQFYVSGDGGVTWTNTDLPTVFGFSAPSSAAFGMSSDGLFFIAIINNVLSGNVTYAFTSIDGIHWTNITSRLPFVAVSGSVPSGPAVTCCNCTPDGNSCVIGFDQSGDVLVSTDRGVTWLHKTYTVNSVTLGNNCNAYILPAGSIH